MHGLFGKLQNDCFSTERNSGGFSFSVQWDDRDWSALAQSVWRHQSDTLCPAHTDRFFVVSSSEKKSEWRSDFYWTESAHTDHFLSQTKFWTYLTIFYRGVIWRTRSDFYRSYCVVTIAEGNSRFLSDQKSAHTNRFSLRFLVCDKKSVRVGLA